MIVPVGPAGSIGIIRDRKPHELPLAAWTDGSNVRFRNNDVERIPGYIAAYGDPLFAPLHLLFVPGQVPLWIYLGLKDAAATDGTNHRIITRRDASGIIPYSTNPDINWNGGVLGGIAVLNNGLDIPQYWPQSNLGTNLSNLTNWPTDHRARVIRPYKNFLVALDVSKASTRYPYMVKWSHPADPGTVPFSWDHTDPTVDAGEYPLGETAEEIVDCGTLRDANIIYKHSSTWGMQHVPGSTYIFRFYKIFENVGLLTRSCYLEFFAGKHAVMTMDDCVIHDGQQAQSLLNARWRKTLFNQLNSSMFERAFVAPNWLDDEVWFCFPEANQVECTKALVWNYSEDRLSMRELPGVSGIATGTVDISQHISTIWNDIVGKWDIVERRKWDLLAVDPTKRQQLMASPTRQRLYATPLGISADGGQMGAFVERQGLGFPLDDGQPPDMYSIKSLTRLWLHAQGQSGETLFVSLGSQKYPGAPVEYKGPFPFVLGRDTQIPCVVTGRLHALKIQSQTNFDWQISGYEAEVQKRGQF